MVEAVQLFCDPPSFLTGNLTRPAWTRDVGSMESAIEYRAECPQCDVEFISDEPWRFCPVHGTPFSGTKAPRKIERDKAVFTVDEAAELFGLSRRTVIRLFEREPGVIVLKRPETLRKRVYRTIRIPRAVYERVVRRISN